MERRDHDRHRVWFPVTVTTDEGDEGTAITYDVSASGLFMACPGKLDVGQHVTVHFEVPASEPLDRAIAATVLRVEETPGEDGPWRFRMALRFDEPQPDLDGILRQSVE